MSTPNEIPIAISISIDESLYNDVMSKLGNLTGKLEEIGKSGYFDTAMRNASNSIQQLISNLDILNKKLADALAGQALVDAGGKMDKFSKAVLSLPTKDLREIFLGIGSDLDLYNANMMLTNTLTKAMINYDMMSADTKSILCGILMETSSAFKDFREAQEAGRVTEEEFNAAVMRADAILRSFARTTRATQLGVQEVAHMQRTWIGQLGATGVAVQELSRNLFWSGLGMMFSYMSVNRLMKSEAQASRSAYSLAKARASLTDAQRAYNEAVMLYGRNSDEAREADRRLVEAQMNLEMQLESTKVAIKSNYQAWTMLIFGTLPTMFRAGGDLLTFFGKLRAAHTTNAAAIREEMGATLNKAAVDTFAAGVTQQSANASMRAAVNTTLESAAKETGVAPTTRLTDANTGLIGSLLAVASASHLARIGLQMVIGLATWGVGFLVSFVATEALAAREMAEMERKARELEYRLTGGSLDDSIRAVTSETEKYGETVRRVSALGFTEGKVPPVIGGVVSGAAPLESPKIEVPAPTGVGGGINVYLTGTWNVRSSSDVRAIAKEIKNSLMRSMYSKRSRY